MDYTWLQNRKSTQNEKIMLVAKIFLICFVIPLIFASKFILDEFQTGEVGICTLGLLLMVLFTILLSLGLLEQLRPLDRVGMGYDNIKLNFIDWPEKIIEWKQIYSIVPLNRNKLRDYNISIKQENSGILSYYLVTEEIASTLKNQMIEKGFRFNYSGKVEVIGDVQTESFCPGCGRKNNGWTFCPDCGRGWD